MYITHLDASDFHEYSHMFLYFYDMNYITITIEYTNNILPIMSGSTVCDENQYLVSLNKNEMTILIIVTD